MSVFSDVQDEYAAKLTAAGLPATVDPAALPPYVLVNSPETQKPTGGIGTWPGEITIVIVVPQPGDLGAQRALDEMRETVMATLGGAQSVAGTYGSKELPSYTVTYPVSVPNPNC